MVTVLRKGIHTVEVGYRHMCLREEPQHVRFAREQPLRVLDEEGLDERPQDERPGFALPFDVETAHLRGPAAAQRDDGPDAIAFAQRLLHPGTGVGPAPIVHSATHDVRMLPCVHEDSLLITEEPGTQWDRAMVTFEIDDVTPAVEPLPTRPLGDLVMDALRPVAGWHLISAAVEMDDVIDRIVRDHATTPAQPPDGLWFEGCADVVALYSRVGSAELFDGVWRLRPISDRRTVWRGHRAHSIAVVIDLADGRSLGAVDDSRTRTTHWVVCRIEEAPSEGEGTNRPRFRLVDEPNEVPVYGTSLALLLDSALDSGGDIVHLETGRLDELDRGIV